MSTKKNNRGSVVMMALIFGGAFSAMLAGLTGYALSQYKNNQRLAAKEQSFHIAESGIEYYRWYLSHALEGLNATEQTAFWQSGGALGYPNPYQADFKDQYGAVIGQFQLEITPPPAGSSAVTIKSTGWTSQFPQTKRVLQTSRRQPGWGQYVLLVNHRANLAEGTVINGQVHSNEDLRVDGIVNNLASASYSAHPDPETGEEVGGGVWTTENPDEVFLGGWQDGVPISDFNILTSKFNLMKETAEGTDFYLGPPEKKCYPNNWFCMTEEWDPAGYVIDLNGDSISIYSAKGFSILGLYLPMYSDLIFLGSYDWPENRLIFSEASVWVKGEVGANQITIAAANLSGEDLPGGNNSADIIIQDDILYNNSEAKVGLVAQDNIMIDRDAGGENLEINAVLIAKNGLVGREDFGLNKGTLTINGAIAANYLSDFGGEYCFSAWCWAGEFQTVELNYDSDLPYNPPPYLPVGEDYETDLWEELE